MDFEALRPQYENGLEELCFLSDVPSHSTVNLWRWMSPRICTTPSPNPGDIIHVHTHTHTSLRVELRKPKKGQRNAASTNVCGPKSILIVLCARMHSFIQINPLNIIEILAFVRVDNVRRVATTKMWYGRDGCARAPLEVVVRIAQLRQVAERTNSAATCVHCEMRRKTTKTGRAREKMGILYPCSTSEYI